MLWRSWRNPIATSTAGKCSFNGFVMAEKQPDHIRLQFEYQSNVFSLKKQTNKKINNKKKKGEKNPPKKTKQKAPLIPVAIFLCVASVISLLCYYLSRLS